MGFFSKLKDKLSPENVFKAAHHPGALIGDKLRDEEEGRAYESVEQAREAQALKRLQFDQLREDAGPLRGLRNENINRLLSMQGIRQTDEGVTLGGADQSGFYQSPEFETVRDAALRVQGTNPLMQRALNERATQLGIGEFGNYHNRIFGTAGFSSSGLANTNRLLQDNIDSQVNLLNNAGAQAAGNLIAGANQRGQAASAGMGLLGSFFCDARLKKNARKVGEYHSGLGKYEWEWTDEAKELVGNQPPVGPMAHEVFEKMPENVTTRDGYLAIKDMRLVHGY